MRQPAGLAAYYPPKEEGEASAAAAGQRGGGGRPQGGGKVQASSSSSGSGKASPQQGNAEQGRKVRLHPCVVQYGKCDYGSRCHFSELPGDTCLNYLRGTCTFKALCRYRHDVAQGGCVGPTVKVIAGVGAVRPVGHSQKLAVVDPSVKSQPEVPSPTVREKQAPRKENKLSFDLSEATPVVKWTAEAPEQQGQQQQQQQQHFDPSGATVSPTTRHWSAPETGLPPPPPLQPAAQWGHPGDEGTGSYSLWGTQPGGFGGLLSGLAEGGGWGEQQGGAGAEAEPKPSNSLEDFPVLGSKPPPKKAAAAGVLAQQRKPQVVTRVPEGQQQQQQQGELRAVAQPWSPPSASPWMQSAKAAPRSGAPPQPAPVMNESRGSPVPLKPGPGSNAKVKLHPCLVQMGSCKYGANCAYARYPADTCLPFLQGHCKFGNSCRNQHARSEVQGKK